MSNSWNAFQKSYVQKHGSTSKSELSRLYKNHGKEGAGAARAKSVSPQRKSPNLTRLYRELPKSRRVKRQKVKSMIAKQHEGRGSPTRGWAAQSPQKGTERHQLKTKCGSKAFLQPEKEGYPVMRLKSGKCEYECRGIQSAYNRSRQYHNEPIAKKALALKNKHC